MALIIDPQNNDEVQPDITTTSSVDGVQTKGDFTRDPFEYDGRSESELFEIGISRFTIDPSQIEVTEAYTNIAAAYPLRTKTSSKRQVGQRQKRITLKLIFPSLDAAWNGPNSLRGLIAQFRSAPFVSVKNPFLNSVHDVDALALVSMNIATVPGLPYTIVAELVSYKFDWKVYVPWYGKFSDIIKDEEYRYYYASAREVLDSYTSSVSDNKYESWASQQNLLEYDDAYERYLSEKFGAKEGFRDLELFYSNRDMSDQTWLNRLGAARIKDPLASNSQVIVDWKEKAHELIENGILKWFFSGGDLTDMSGAINGSIAESMESILGTESDFQVQFNAFMSLASMGEYFVNRSDSEVHSREMNDLFLEEFNKIKEEYPAMDSETAKDIAYYRMITNTTIFDRILNEDNLVKIFRESGVTWVHEWEMPMMRMGLMNKDLANSVIVEAVTVTTQNAIVANPLEGRVDAVHQFLGSLGTKATVSLKVIGERAIKHMREVFDSICTSSAKNRDSGVTGFLGVRNELTALMGMKYALLDSWTTSTIEGYPHVYSVQLELSDFDIMQQKRETPLAIERLKILEDSTIGHPMLRARQLLSKTNAYPDLPLPRMKYEVTKLHPVAKGSNSLLQGVEYVTTVEKGRYLDPDFYFKTIRKDWVEDKKKEVSTADGEKIVSLVPDGYEMELTPQNDDINALFKVYSGTTDDPYNILISASANDFSIDDIAVDQTNPQSVANKAITSDIFNILNKYDISTTETGQRSLYDGSKFNDLESLATGDSSDPLSLDKETFYSLKSLYGNDETDNFRQMIEEDFDSSLDGMIKAFPTYMVYLIDEGGKLLTYKLFDTFYGIQSLISADIMLDKEAPLDTAVLQFSNIYSKLSTSQWYMKYSMPAFIQTIYTTAWTAKNRVFGLVNELENLEIQGGMRMQIRLGYSANPESLPIIFNGTVSEVTHGSVMTVVVQGDGIELSRITGRNYSSKAATYSIFGAAMVEPQDLIVKYLGVSSTIWKQYISRASLGMNPGDGSGGAAHFGAALWNTDLYGGDAAFNRYVKSLSERVMSRLDRRLSMLVEQTNQAENATDVDWVNACINVFGSFSDNAGDIIKQGFQGFTNLTEDFEIIKRNVYPGNGTGYRRYFNSYEIQRNPMGKFHNLLWSTIKPSYYDKYTQISADTDSGSIDERTFKINTGGKTNWEIFKMCESLLPNYVLAVRPFEHRSTLFYGKQNWLYTSGVVPLFDADGLGDYELTMKEPKKIIGNLVGSTSATTSVDAMQSTAYGPDDVSYHENNTCIHIRTDYKDWGLGWLEHPSTMEEMSRYSALGGSDYAKKNWSEFFTWLSNKKLMADVLLMKTVENPTEMPLFSMLIPTGTGGMTAERAESLRLMQAYFETSPSTKYVYYFTSTPTKIYGADSWPTNLGNLAVIYDKETLNRILSDSSGSETQANNFLEIMQKSEYRIVSPDAVNAIHQSKTTSEFREAFFSAWSIFIKEKTSVSDRMGLIEGLSSSPFRYESYIKSAFNKMKNDIGTPSADIDNPGTNGSLVTKTAAEMSYPIIIDPLTYAESIANPDNPGVTIKWIDPTTEESIVSITDSSTVIDRVAQNDSVLNAIAYLGSMVFGGVDQMLDASYYNQSYVMAQWDALNDSSYYGLLAGTDYDPYVGADLAKKIANAYESGADPILIEMLLKENGGLNEKVLELRKLQIACDNPFSREFGEPVLEVREPFSRMHYITSETNIIYNGLFKDQTAVANQVRAIAHSSANNNAAKEVVVKADSSIPAHLVREKIVDTGINYEAFSWHDLENHKNMARKALKDSLQTMYGGELLCFGDPKLRPFDFLYMWDTPNKMNGWSEITRVTHHIGIDTGFTTAVKVAPIVVIDDAYLFGLMTSTYPLQLDRVSRELILQNVATGSVNLSTVQANNEHQTLQSIVQKTLGLVDGNAGSYKTMYLVGSMIPVAAVSKSTSFYEQLATAIVDKNGDTVQMDSVKYESDFNKRINEAGISQSMSSEIKKLAEDYYKESNGTIGSFFNESSIDDEKLRKKIETRLLSLSYGSEWLSPNGVYESIVDLNAAVDMMYQFVLDWIKLLAIRDSEKLLADYLYSVSNATTSGGVVSEMTLIEDDPTSQAKASQEALALMVSFIDPETGAKYKLSDGVLSGLIGNEGTTGIGNTFLDSIVKEFSDYLIPSGTIGAAGSFAAFSAGAPIVGSILAMLATGLIIAGPLGYIKLSSWLAEQEPVSIILLSQNGYPYYAGIHEANGIIAGQPSSLPILDKFGYQAPADDVGSLWLELGYSLAESRNIKEAESIARTRVSERVRSESYQLEQGVIDGLDTSVVVTVRVSSVYDGDTITLAYDTPVVIDGISIKQPNKVRLRFINTPEIASSPVDQDMFLSLPTSSAQYGAKVVRDYVARILGASTSDQDRQDSYNATIKVKVNKLQPVDEYDRVLGIVVTPSTCSDFTDEFILSEKFDWLTHSLNGKLLFDPETAEYVSPYLFLSGMSQVNGLEYFVGSSTGTVHNLDYTERTDVND